MKKNPTRGGGSFVVKGIKVVLALEFAAVGITYFFWSRMNRSQEYRYKIHQQYPSLLKGYYMIGEHLGGLDTQAQDYKAWGITDHKS